MIQVVRQPDDQDASVSTLAQLFIGNALPLLFADAAQIARLRELGSGPIELRPPYHVSEDDTYLLLPDDIGDEIVDILRDADAELLQEALRDGLLVHGQVGKNPRGRGMALDALRVSAPSELLAQTHEYAATVDLGSSLDALRALNTLPHLQCTTLSALVDDDGLEAMLRNDEHIGVSWRPPASAQALQDLEPTHVWSKRLDARSIGVELALFREDEELIAVLRPVRVQT